MSTQSGFGMSQPTPMAALSIRIRCGVATAAETKEWRRLAAIDFAARMLGGAL